jgi:hypothetical protein
MLKPTATLKTQMQEGDSSHCPFVVSEVWLYNLIFEGFFWLCLRSFVCGLLLVLLLVFKPISLLQNFSKVGSDTLAVCDVFFNILHLDVVSHVFVILNNGIFPHSMDFMWKKGNLPNMCKIII